MNGFWKNVWKFFKTPIADHVKNLWNTLRDFFTSPSRSRWIAIIGIIIVVIALPVTVIILQQRTQIEQKAANPCETLHGVCVRANFCSANCEICDTTKGCTASVCCGTCQVKAIDHRFCCNDFGKYHYCQNQQLLDCSTRLLDLGYSSDCAPKPTPTPDVNQCTAKNHPYTGPDGKTHYTSDATCAKYNCGNGYVSIGGACSFSDSTCCISAKEYGGSNYQVQYTCSNNGSAFQGADGSYTYCPSGKACKPKTQYATNNGINDASSHLCLFTPDSCDVKGGSCEKYQCNNGEVTMAGTCSFTDSVCCIKGTATYSCINQNDPNYTAIKGTDGSVSYCPQGYFCTGKPVQSSTGSGPAITQLCSPNFLPVPAGGSRCVGAYADGKTGLGVCEFQTADRPFFSPKYIDICVKSTSDENSTNVCGLPSDLPTCDKMIASSVQATKTSVSCKQDWNDGNNRCCLPKEGAGPAPSGSPNYCQYATKGNGGYCGSVLGHGANTNHVYDCTNQQTTKDTDCGSNGCVVNASGSDYCKGNGGPPPPACTPGKDTKLALSVKLEGIGTGDLENHDPKRPNRSGSVRVFDASNPSGSVSSSSQAFNHNKGNGKFDTTTVDVGNKLACSATYKVEVKIPGYLPATANVKYGDTGQVISLEPLPGDINRVNNNGVIVGDGKIDINDYSIYRQCRNVDPNTPIPFSSDTTTVNVKCGDLINFFDFQDGGTMESNVFAASGIGEWDANYNLWLRSYLKANGL